MSRPPRRRWSIAARVLAVVVAAITLVVLGPGTAAPAGTDRTAPGGSPRLPTGERQALARAHAFTTRPVRFLLLGDSIALTLGTGLSRRSVSLYGVSVTDDGTLGCDLDDLPVRLSGVVGPPTPGCIGWRTTWPRDIQRDRPDVVGLLVGRWEVSDHRYLGHWVHVGDRRWDAHLIGELDQAIDVFTADGARVVLFTMPYVDPPGKTTGGAPFPENLPRRARAFNALVRQVATAHPKAVTVIDLNELIDPEGHYQAVVHGITVRWSDGIHITTAGGAWLRPFILPTVARLGLEARPSVDARSDPSRRAPR